MIAELIEDVDKIIMHNRSNIPEGYFWWQTTKRPENEEELIEVLLKIFEKEEDAIKYQQKHSVDTNNYEDNVRNFAIALLKRLEIEHEVLKSIRSYRNLLGQKYMAYSFYHLLEINVVDSNSILKNTTYEEYLYRGLVKFYTMFYGRFADNEEAICLLCKYYPKGNDSWLDKKDVVIALIDHIRNAGTPEDRGYAYRGIEQIQQHIHGLPDELI